MSNIEKTISKLSKGNEAYYADDFYDAAIRIVPIGNNKFKTYLKFKHRQENEIDNSNDTAMQIELGGKEITMTEYLKF